jgi:hypothetical protein
MKIREQGMLAGTFFTPMMKIVISSETSVLTRTYRHDILGGGILHSYRYENLKSYITLTGWTL